MREIVLDTETTGLDPLRGDRLVEIGCVEIVNRFVTGQVFHRYINPERPMSPEAFAVHGLSDAFLSDKPVFRQVADEFLAFIGDDPLVIHNASFDMGFLNAELKRLKKGPLASDIQASRTRSTRSARATASTTAAVRATARCSMRKFWRRSMPS
jgi:DNA polymerase III subunit epsilon